MVGRASAGSVVGTLWRRVWCPTFAGSTVVTPRARHESLGDGTFTHLDDTTVSVLFDRGEYRTLSVELVLHDDLMMELDA